MRVTKARPLAHSQRLRVPSPTHSACASPRPLTAPARPLALSRRLRVPSPSHGACAAPSPPVHSAQLRAGPTRGGVNLLGHLPVRLRGLRPPPVRSVRLLSHSSPRALTALAPAPRAHKPERQAQHVVPTAVSMRGPPCALEGVWCPQWVEGGTVQNILE